MSTDLTADRVGLLCTVRAGRTVRRAAFAVALLSSLVFLVVVPFARTPLPRIDAFIPSYQSALIVSDLVTAILLLGQFGVLGSRALLVLATGYLFTALMAAAHTLTFPGLFTATGLLGAGPDTTAWIYMFWHSGFPLVVIVYALVKAADPTSVGTALDAPRRAHGEIVIAIVTAAAVASGLTVLATAGRAVLPVIMNGSQMGPRIVYVIYPVWALSFVALAALWWCRPHSVLDMWLIAVMCAWVAEIALSSVFNGGRFTLGYYVGRLYGLAAANFVLAVLLLEISVLYGKLVRSFETLAQRTRELTALNQELDSFAHTVAHDLRAPLITIDGYSRILIEDAGPSLDGDAQHRLHVVAGSAQRMGQLIDGLLAFARLGRRHVTEQTVHPGEIARAAWTELNGIRGERPVDLRIENLPSCRGDSVLLKQVYVNLLSNALKFSRKSEAPLIEVGWCGSAEEPGYNIYFVKDNGAGFNMEYADKLFRVFQRLHSADEFEGTGIGLATVQRIVQRHGGRVWAEGAVGKGATFFFTLRQNGGPGR
jgi:signal transduction histidine kinase